MFKKISILLTMMWLLVGSVSFADHLTADPQSDAEVTKYRIMLDDEVLPADIENIGSSQVQLYYNIDHLGDGRHVAVAAAGNETEWSGWSDSIAFYRGVPTPENIYLYCGGAVEESTEDPMRLSRDNWEITYVSSEDSEKGKFASLAIDGNINTYWRTDVNHPHEIQIDLGKTYHISGFYYLARQDTKWNGTIKEFAVYGSLDGINWMELSFGELTKTKDEQLVEFATQNARYINLVSLSEVDGGRRAVISELNILGKE